MSSFWLGNLYLLLMMICAAASQIVLKALLNETGPIELNWSFVQQLYFPGKFFRFMLSLVLLVAALPLWYMSLSRLDLSYAYSVACLSLVIVTFLSVVFLHETVSVKMWCGIALILLGTILLSVDQSVATTENSQRKANSSST